MEVKLNNYASLRRGDILGKVLFNQIDELKEYKAEVKNNCFTEFTARFYVHNHAKFVKERSWYAFYAGT